MKYQLYNKLIGDIYVEYAKPRADIDPENNFTPDEYLFKFSIGGEDCLLDNQGLQELRGFINICLE